MSILTIILIVIIAIPVVFFLLMQIMNITHNDPPTSTQKETVTIPDLDGPVRGVSTFIEEDRYHVDPISFSGSPEEAIETMKNILKSYARSKIIKSTGNYIYATIISPVWRFVDDIEVLYDEEKKIYHWRSGPRFGKTDLGVNKERYLEIKSEITGEPLEIPLKGVKREDIPEKEVNLLIIVSAICSAMIIGSYLIWLLVIPDFYETTGVIILVLSIVLTIFSSAIVLMLLKQKSFKSMTGPTVGWIIILIAFSIWSQIYLLIPVAIAQLLVDLRFYKLVDSMAEK